LENFKKMKGKRDVQYNLGNLEGGGGPTKKKKSDLKEDEKKNLG
jgi:hypothetical protein